MIAKHKIIILCIFVGFGMLLCVFVSPFRYIPAQIKLAKEIGVKIGDYPSPTYFPAGYFSSKLIPGMSLDEVHQIITGYDKVVTCSTTGEIYFYFGDDDTRALRILVHYKDIDGRLDNGIQELRFKEFECEDDQSRAFGDTSNCSQGLLTKTEK